jgi:hypothetical protein
LTVLSIYRYATDRKGFLAERSDDHRQSCRKKRKTGATPAEGGSGLDRFCR